MRKQTAQDLFLTLVLEVMEVGALIISETKVPAGMDSQESI
jgi:hypothetical protein